MIFICTTKRLWRQGYVCMVITHGKVKDQPGKVASAARGQLNRENDFLPCPRSRLRSLARRVRWSRPSSACLFSTPRLNLLILIVGKSGKHPDWSRCTPLFRHTLQQPYPVDPYSAISDDHTHMRMYALKYLQYESHTNTVH